MDKCRAIRQSIVSNLMAIIITKALLSTFLQQL